MYIDFKVNRSGFNPTKNKICVGLKPDLYTPDEIHLASADGNVKGIFCYNPELNPIRQLLAINAYDVAKKFDTVIEID